MPKMRLFDTMSREVRELSPLDGQVFRFYCCGPTVYGPAHIGNFRTFVLQDVFRRTLELSGVKAFHVRNLTDVDDKTIRDSQAGGRTLKEFTDFWRDRFHEDCAKLNLLPPHIEPSAVEHIPHQIEMIRDLMEKGHAYASDDGSVYFKVSSFEGYGRLSRLDQRELREGASGSVSDDEYEKDSVSDFALWKARRDEDGDNYWDSPWGQGRPGWHLECSAMCREYLGDTFDLHSGGVDLVFPHHENEIAQSEAATGKIFARHWFHVAHLTVDGRKMSKSLGNLYTLADLAELGHTPMELRYVLLSGCYRQPLNFTFASLAAARKALARIAGWQRRLGGAPDFLLPGEEDFGPFGPVLEALLADLNTPEALGRLHAIGREVIAAHDAGLLPPAEIEAARHGLALVLQCLGLDLSISRADAADAAEAPAWVEALAAERLEARRQRDWALADRLRDQIHEAGWTLCDGTEGSTLKPLGIEKQI